MQKVRFCKRAKYYSTLLLVAVAFDADVFGFILLTRWFKRSQTLSEKNENCSQTARLAPYRKRVSCPPAAQLVAQIK